MKPVELKNGIYWVGAVDWAIRDFHGYETPRGTSYNNYLIVDEEPTLLDAVHLDFVHISIENITRILEPQKIKNIIINHIENDHATGLEKILEYTPQANIYITEKGKKGLSKFIDLSKYKVNTVKTGDHIKIGKRTLHFIETPMMHWPDSMFTYIKEEKILISQDAFGQHIASVERFDDEFINNRSMDELEDSVIDYYANILMLYGNVIKAKIEEIKKSGVEIEMIAPDHGVIWRSHIDKVISLYSDMVEAKAKLGAVIVYDTMWHSTEQMVFPIAKGLEAEGIPVKIIKLRSTPKSVAIKEIWKYRGVIVGSPTLNNNIFPSVADFLTYLKGLRPKNRLFSAFGSYGWSGEAVKDIFEYAKAMKLELFEPGIRVLYKPSEEELNKCYEFGIAFGKALKEYHAKF
ncbi:MULTISPECIES: FprA family A-type flavoprotein [Thermodesulfovibrio]|jgi:flavorubredoxin|uniref:Rubredoxin-oxygen oxidoreductase n=1 Tax=Thermodesulfovibrio yellowstonii (strain ATCC 51303 / DSM 11347 / YP87) TaxID=289376 RepID=B5YHI9_THEYD|nr:MULTISPECIES: FprA family A-type flavoprotein [Thermodesulfovibrio]ACI21565.1 rubredoxin-oxygen oxidoreductase [Thermodesulfovibrio yellowstonii DSM 11347]